MSDIISMEYHLVKEAYYAVSSAASLVESLGSLGLLKRVRFPVDCRKSSVEAYSVDDVPFVEDDVDMESYALVLEDIASRLCDLLVEHDIASFLSSCHKKA